MPESLDRPVNNKGEIYMGITTLEMVQKAALDDALYVTLDGEIYYCPEDGFTYFDETLGDMVAVKDFDLIANAKWECVDDVEFGITPKGIAYIHLKDFLSYEDFEYFWQNFEEDMKKHGFIRALEAI